MHKSTPGCEADGFRDPCAIEIRDLADFDLAPSTDRISILRLSVVEAAAEPLMAEAAHLVDDREQGAALRRQRVLDPWR